LAIFKLISSLLSSWVSQKKEKFEGFKIGSPQTSAEIIPGEAERNRETK
jgi:hypothetical protein